MAHSTSLDLPILVATPIPPICASSPAASTTYIPFSAATLPGGPLFSSASPRISIPSQSVPHGFSNFAATTSLHQPTVPSVPAPSGSDTITRVTCLAQALWLECMHCGLLKTIVAKTRAWESEQNSLFIYHGVPLLSILQNELLVRRRKEEKRKRMESTRGICYLTVTVIKGTNLAIRDIFSSDPYVMVQLYRQKVRSTIKNSNLNPVWNEVLKLRVPQNYGALKLQVFDHDLFSTDDNMGEAEVDIHPMVTSALAFGDPSPLENTQIGNWFKTSDNSLIKDSMINIVDGKFKQEVSLKHQNVECGELYLELEWVPLEE